MAAKDTRKGLVTMCISDPNPTQQVHGGIRRAMEAGNHDFDAWWALMIGGTATLADRGNQNAVDGVRDFMKWCGKGANPLDVALCVLDEGTPGYELVMAGKAHINDGVTRCGEDYCVKIDEWAHMNEADVTALYAKNVALRKEVKALRAASAAGAAMQP